MATLMRRYVESLIGGDKCRKRIQAMQFRELYFYFVVIYTIFTEIEH